MSFLPSPRRRRPLAVAHCGPWLRASLRCAPAAPCLPHAATAAFASANILNKWQTRKPRGHKKPAPHNVSRPLASGRKRVKNQRWAALHSETCRIVSNRARHQVKVTTGAWRAAAQQQNGGGASAYRQMRRRIALPCPGDGEWPATDRSFKPRPALAPVVHHLDAPFIYCCPALQVRVKQLWRALVCPPIEAQTVVGGPTSAGP